MDVAHHGVYIRSRQELQDAIIHQHLMAGIPTERPYFVLAVGAEGSGKHHTIRWLERNGRFPLNAFVWFGYK